LEIEIERDKRAALHTVMITVYQKDGSSLMCSGTAISPQHILTAAHCLSKADRLELGSGPRGQSLADFGRLKFAIHPKWKLGPVDDIAIIASEFPLPLQHALVTKSGALKLGEAIVLAGYGSTAESRDDAGYLRVARSEVESIDLEKGTFNLISRSGRGGCHGDSGGPGFVERDGYLGLAGVISGGSIRAPCDVGHGTLSLLSKNLEWITCISKAMFDKDGSLIEKGASECKDTRISEAQQAGKR
jgi:hypothetical protein